MIVKRADFVRAIEAGIAAVHRVRDHNFEQSDFEALRNVARNAARSCIGQFRVSTLTDTTGCPLTQAGIQESVPYKVGQSAFWCAYDETLADSIGRWHMGVFDIADY